MESRKELEIAFLYHELIKAIKELKDFKKTKERYGNRANEFKVLLTEKEKLLIKKGNDILEQIAFVENISDMDKVYVNINDIVDFIMVYADDDEEEMTLKLVSGDATTFDGRLSVLTPLGMAIYGKKIGDTISYKVNNDLVKVKLLSKTKGI